MRLSISIDGPDGEGSGPVSVGWLFTQNRGSVIFDPPTRLRDDRAGDAPAKSVSRCPAILNFSSRFFQVTCPYDLELGFQRGDGGRPEIVNLLGDQSPVRNAVLSQLIDITPESEWRHPERPIFQLRMPHLFIADEPVFLNQLAPFAHYRSDPLPGLMLGGRMPIHIWPRPLLWAFEWHDTGRPITLSRGEPLYYLQFETLPQDRSVRLVKAEETDDLKEYLDAISGVVNYVNQTFRLFGDAEARRPKRLVKEVDPKS